MYEDKNWPRQLYLLPLLMFVVIWFKPATLFLSINDYDIEAKINALPNVPLEEIRPRMDALKESLENISHTSGTPIDYFSYLADIRFLKYAAERHELMGLAKYEGVDQGVVTLARINFMAVGQLENLLFAKGDELGMRSPGLTESDLDVYRKDYYDSRMSRYEDRSLWTEEKPVWPYTKFAFLMTMIFAAPAFFVIRLQRSGLEIPIELPRILFWSVIWPVGIFKYPDNIDWAQQRRDFKRFIAGLGTILLSLAGMGVAHAKSKTGNSKSSSEIEVVDESESANTIFLKDGDGTQVLPTLVVDGAELKIYGWAFATCEAVPSDCGLRHGKIRGVVSKGSSELFFQGNWFNNFGVDTLAFRRHFDSGLRLQLGRIFTPSADVVPAPFVQETISDDGLPVAFFGTGVALNGPINDRWSFSAALTGKSGSRLLSDDHFDRLDFSANVKRVIPHGHAMLSVQKAGDTRVIADVGQQYGDHQIRGALSYRTAGDQVGGYVFYQYEGHQYLQPFARVSYANDNWLGIVGMNIPANDNIDFSVEGRSDGTFGVKVRARF